MIHKYKQLGLNIVMDIYSGAVHVLDDVMYDMLDYITEPFTAEDKCPESVKTALNSRYSDEDIEESYREICALHENGQLFTEDCYDEIAKNWNKQSVVKALCIHVAHDCNLRCKYCFADTGEFHGGRSLMSAEVGKKAIDFVISNSGARRNIEIDYFGGEPLMNFDVVKEITEYAKEQGEKHNKNFRFTITTNGILLDDEVMDYINQNMSNVVLSLDGTKETNDKVRYRVDGSGSYDSIVPKFQKLAESRNQDNYYVRGTFTAYNTDFAKDVIHLADLGFKQTSVEPVVAPETEDYALKEEHIEAVLAEYDKLAEEYAKRYDEGRGFNFFHFMVDLDQGPCAIKRLSGCGAGHEYLAVAPNGDIYPCHQFVGNTDFLMGNVKDNTFNEDIKNQFERSNVYTKPKCADCFSKFYCSGGCSANAYNFNKDINKPYELACEFQKKRLECAIAVEAHKKLNKFKEEEK
ncbi:MAG: thioether cross-link-forming SCIFF peptide maturase [Oscillospiraceae bacterium]|nr:thioether cross-link-forming SCIFF peptide maturase [Oscillospiraceae bacterium]